jgi:hypothetical protein
MVQQPLPVERRRVGKARATNKIKVQQNVFLETMVLPLGEDGIADAKRQRR